MTDQEKGIANEIDVKNYNHPVMMRMRKKLEALKQMLENQIKCEVCSEIYNIKLTKGGPTLFHFCYTGKLSLIPCAGLERKELPHD